MFIKNKKNTFYNQFDHAKIKIFKSNKKPYLLHLNNTNLKGIKYKDQFRMFFDKFSLSNFFTYTLKSILDIFVGVSWWKIGISEQIWSV